MYYYGIDFNPTEELVSDWGISDIDDGAGGCIDVLGQTFYVKSSSKIETKEQMKNHLLANFKPNEKYHEDLVNCVYPATANEIYDFWEIDGVEFELSCGIPA